MPMEINYEYGVTKVQLPNAVIWLISPTVASLIAIFSILGRREKTQRHRSSGETLEQQIGLGGDGYWKILVGYGRGYARFPATR